MKLLKVVKSDRKEKRFTAIFFDGKKEKKVHFGLKNPKKGTFIDHKDETLKKNYRARHQKDLKTNDPLRPGYLSYYLLWNKPTLKESIEDYKKRFSL